MSTGPSVRTFLRFLTGRRTLLISAPFSRGVMSVSLNVITPQGLEPLQFPTKFRSPSKNEFGVLLNGDDSVFGPTRCIK